MTVKHIRLQWYQCSQCGFENMASKKTKCPKCGCLLTAVANAGHHPDTRDKE